MRLPTLMSLVLAVSLAGAAVPAPAAAPERDVAPERAPAERTPPVSGVAANPVNPATNPTSAPNTAPATRPGERRRRPSYAACNRESHRRNLYGGPRRRFLIRCRLGYEQRRPGPAAGPARRP
ncbi:hypothetical protein HNR00_000064 [Methylorubrum rhodinum]|uniref:Serine/threonine protein kinase n=1 Tax=Methylorubrum rhodinum TaxID=29428 RepID=A0A840ZDU9_9HYPH|nr:serine/threonine protein kinase [Methylorubrum rhodinum]MBB5755375.1 hypothetical protein [Methylorubrum rhodinum]